MVRNRGGRPAKPDDQRAKAREVWINDIDWAIIGDRAKSAGFQRGPYMVSDFGQQATDGSSCNIIQYKLINPLLNAHFLYGFNRLEVRAELCHGRLFHMNSFFRVISLLQQFNPFINITIHSAHRPVQMRGKIFSEIVRKHTNTADVFN